MSKEALSELLAKVDAGEASCIRSMAHKAFGGRPYTFPKGDALRAGNAYDGSLDAAKELHEALLPGKSYSIHNYVSPRAAVRVGMHTGSDPEPARAWLCAILKALISQESGVE